MVKEINTKLPIVLVGDIHGDWKSFLQKIEYIDLRESILICVGDVGIGFYKTKSENLENIRLLEQRFSARGIRFYGIRGNHDDPVFFDGSVDLDYFKLIPDYTELKINGESWLFVGGATSIDRKYRTNGKDYWADEKFVLDKTKAKGCDVLVCHTAPRWLGPADKVGLVSQCCKYDPGLWEELVEERSQMNELYEICQPKQFFCGHFHMTLRSGDAHILDIFEFHEYKSR